MANVLGFKLVFKGIAESIHRTIQLLQQEAANGAISVSTEVRFESELFCVESILQGADHTDEETFTMLQQLLELVLAINYTKQKLLGTALEILVGCSKFFGQRLDLLQSAFKFLGNTIQFKSFEDNSAEAIANLCRDNKNFVLENISDFFDCSLLLTSLQQSLLQERHRHRPHQRGQLAQQPRNQDRAHHEDLPALRQRDPADHHCGQLALRPH